jgi:dTMP kinase
MSMQRSSKGKLFVLDGIDGTGKATQTRELVKRLQSMGKEVETLDFPQYERNLCGRILYRALKNVNQEGIGEFGDFLALHPKVASAIYAADRAESAPMIHGWLDAGKIVILDRYVSSNMIHQGGKISDEAEAMAFIEWLDKLEHELMGTPRPDAIVYLDVTAEVAATLLRKRAAEKGGRELDAVEQNLGHMIASRERALSITGKLNNWERVDCSDEESETKLKTVPVIHEMVFGAISKYL